MNEAAEARAQPAAERSYGHAGGAPARGLQGFDRLFAILMLVAVALVHWQIVNDKKVGVLDGELGDTDAYSWMIRATDLMETGDWFDATLDRVNPPEGLRQHWTRPLDTLIIAGALPLTLVMDREDALFLSGTLLSPFLHLIGLAVLLWGAGPLLGRGRVPLLGILYLAQVGIIGYSSAGRPDHHALILLLTNALIVLSMRVATRPPDKRLSLGLGGVMALGLWTGAEFLVSVFGCLLGFGLLWLKGGRQSAVSEKMVWTGIGAAVAGMVAVLLERGSAVFAPAFAVDRFSTFHVFLLIVTAGFWLAVRWSEERGLATGTLRGRAGLAAGLAAAAGVLLTILFPALLAFDLVPMDAFYRQTRYTNILEFQPLISAHAIATKGMWDTIFQTILQIGIVLPALGFMIWALVRERRDPRWRIWLILTTIAAVMLAVYTTQGGIEYRDAPYLEMIALIPYAELSYRIIRQIGKRFAGLQRSVIRPFATALLISWYVFPAFTANAVADEEGPKVSGRTACPVKSAAPVLRKLNDPARLQTIMAFVDFGPELMYRTPHAVLSIPNHHAQPGYRQTWDAMTAPGPEAAKPLIAGQGVDFVLVCDNKIPDGFYGQLGAVDTFRHALIAGRAPAWLTPVSLPETADGFRLYRVVPESDPER